ncbi:putative glycolipid mannosyltransferase [Naematelia encephala]|uniref:Alpha-1,3/1,6-mannosyltransferase ALG2 n=1 Tax=Naematelia encephala TaxID=71784 RepID=A0A1Y2AZ66_9TREE|nr:putative glycolipid mannosyltransferase [Naematelia encephala]
MPTSAVVDTTDKNKEKLRIGFIHPDLGIGGAERLVVDAAVSLQRRGHDVVVFTSRHDPARCFEETRDGTLKVHVLGSSLPMRLHPRVPLTILFSILRSLLLTVLLILSAWIPPPPGLINPVAPLGKFDIFFVDQQSVCVPLLRFALGTRVVFYCHFPDKLLSGGWEVGEDKAGEGLKRSGVGLAKKLYRWPVDKLEEWTTGQADVVLSNSHFTSRVYGRSFPSLAKRPPRVVYPCIDIQAYRTKTSRKGKGKAEEGVDLISSDRPTLISLNRFEAKKNAALAIKAFAALRDDSLIPHDRFADLRLIIAGYSGGYDSSLPDNVETLARLQDLCDELSLTQHTISSTTTPSPPEHTQVVFLLNFSTAQRSYLLTSPSTLALLYTPANEHFGIVPLEAMACGLPVLAADSGGPTETIISLPDPGATGVLKPPNVEEWAPALAELVLLDSSKKEQVSSAAKKRVEEKFSLETLGKELEQACRDALGMGDLHMQMGDQLIWGGLALMVTSGAVLGVTLYNS